MLEAFATPARHGILPPLPLSQARSPICPTPARSPLWGPGTGAAVRAGARRELLVSLAPFLALMLDEVDHGMLLVDADAQALIANHAARCELDTEHALQIAGTQLLTTRVADAGVLQEALGDAQRGLRRLLTLGRGKQRVSISVVPLCDADGSCLTLVMMGKRSLCGKLPLQGYARAMALTPAETRVLEQLCEGVKPTAIALHQDVAVSTVRTQIGSMRAKTGASSIRELVGQVAMLPPMVGALRSSSADFGVPRMPLAA